VVAPWEPEVALKMGVKVHPRIVSGPTWKMARSAISPGSGHGTGPASHCYDGEVIRTANLAWAASLRTVFLDRDGILNEKMPEHHYVTRWEEFRVLPGVPEALRRLNEAGLRLVVVSNQRGIAKGLYTAADLEAIHAKFLRLLELEGARIDAFFICPHEENECNCRKPLPGLFEQAVARFPEIKAATSVMIGDSPTDVEFGRRLGMKTIFIDALRGAAGAEEDATLADLRFGSLSEAVDAVLAAR
jgi:D-glycero-D-manno-heptose 1,7-bisphosphate phosphatase